MAVLQKSFSLRLAIHQRSVENNSLITIPTGHGHGNLLPLVYKIRLFETRVNVVCKILLWCVIDFMWFNLDLFKPLYSHTCGQQSVVKSFMIRLFSTNIFYYMAFSKQIGPENKWSEETSE